MPHGHGGPGENPEEIHAFADIIVNGGQPLGKVTGARQEGRHVEVTYQTVAPIVKAEFNYTKDIGVWQNRLWQTIPAEHDAAHHVVSATLPDGVSVYYFNIVDERGQVVSSEHVVMK